MYKNKLFMKNIPTSLEFLYQDQELIFDIIDSKFSYSIALDILQNKLIEFAKLHVEEQAKEVLENIPCLGSSTDIPTYEEMEEAVLNAYPLTNIK